MNLKLSTCYLTKIHLNNGRQYHTYGTTQTRKLVSRANNPKDDNHHTGAVSTHVQQMTYCFLNVHNPPYRNVLTNLQGPVAGGTSVHVSDYWVNFHGIVKELHGITFDHSHYSSRLPKMLCVSFSPHRTFFYERIIYLSYVKQAQDTPESHH